MKVKNKGDVDMYFVDGRVKYKGVKKDVQQKLN
jgi:hypothetical protein